MPSLDHVHTYVRYKDRSGTKLAQYVFRCDHPECTNFAPAELVIGKKASCSVCGQEYILDSESARRVRPRCMDCSNTAKGRMRRLAAAGLERLFAAANRTDDFLLPDDEIKLREED